ncbi:hypothetical protein PSCFBP2116_P100014 [Pseudomonas syringae]|nr:hypothetical protein PSCFBP2116_P100014 [Pseudomonas syringae]
MLDQDRRHSRCLLAMARGKELATVYQWAVNVAEKPER